VSLSGFSLFPHKLAFPEAVKLSTETEGSLIRITNTSKVPLDFFISDYIGSDVQISISWDNSLTNVPPGASRTIRATAVVHAPLQLNLSLLLVVLGTPHAHTLSLIQVQDTDIRWKQASPTRPTRSASTCSSRPSSMPRPRLRPMPTSRDHRHYHHHHHSHHYHQLLLL